MIGKLLGGRYRLERLLGEGGMGAVYEATNIAIGKRVAVKTILPDKAVRPEAVERFRREAFAMAAVDSEHVAAILDAGDDVESGAAFFVMELLAGEDLSRLLQRVRVLAPQAALRIVAQVLQGLQAAHEAGVAHRDIKPANLFLVRRRDSVRAVKLVDFGIARNLTGDDGPASRKVTRTGSVVGSPAYMSPEQFSSRAQLDFRTDLWSLGVVLFELLGGLNPYTLAEDFPHMMAWICFQPPPSLRDFAPWTPSAVVAVVERAMTQRAGDRYGSAAEMLADCRRLIHGSPELTDAMLVPPPEAGQMAGAGQTVRMVVPFPAGSAPAKPPPPASPEAPLAGVLGPPSARPQLGPPSTPLSRATPGSDPRIGSGSTLPLAVPSAPLAAHPVSAATPGSSAFTPPPSRRWNLLVAAGGILAGAGVMAFVYYLMVAPRPGVVTSSAAVATGTAGATPTETASSAASTASGMAAVPPAGPAPLVSASAAVSAAVTGSGRATPPASSPAPARNTAVSIPSSSPFGGQRGITK